MPRLPLVGLLVAACTNAGTSTPVAVPLDEIAGRRWVVEAVEPASDAPASWSRVAADLTLDAATGTAGGHGGCNRWNASFSSEAPGTIRFANAASTMMACSEPGLMEREREFLSALQAVTTWRLGVGQLVLEGPAGERISLRLPPA